MIKNKATVFSIIFFAFLNVFLLYKFFLDKNGIKRVLKIEKSIDELQRQIETLKKSNINLIKTIKNLRNDPEFMKRLIKKEMLFIEKDEVIYLIKGENKN